MKNIKNKKPTLIVAIPAYNEEANIANVIDSLIHQEKKNFTMEKIVVYSDASTDNTEKIVSRISKHLRIVKLVRGNTRRGKMYRLNEIFHSCSSDILVVVDADIKLSGKNFLNHLIHDIVYDSKAQLVSAHQVPLRPANFIGKIIYASFITWDYIRLGVPNYDHLQNFCGAATAYRGIFAKTLRIPKAFNEERLYLYSQAKKVNGFRYSYSAKIFYLPVATFHDFVGLSHRSFGSKMSDVYTIPFSYKVKGLIKSFLHQPLYATLGLVLNIFIGKLRPKKIINNSPLWDISLSTKKSI